MLERQIVDTETGEVKSRGLLGENTDFVMISRKSFYPMRELGKKDPKARILLDFFLEHMDRENALVVSRELIAEMMEWSLPTVDRKIKFLVDNKYLNSVRTGNSSLYFVNADIAWTTYGNKKQYAKFKANVLIGKSEQEYRLKYSKNKQLELIPKIAPEKTQ